MNEDTDSLGVGIAVPGRQLVLALAVGGVLALLSIYRDTFLSLVDIWQRSDTFAHGFLIFPISAWLIWRRRRILAAMTPNPDYRAVPVLVLLGIGWLLARFASVLVVQQYALVGMVPVLLWMLLGWRMVREIAFPLGFLLLAVPAGEFLLAPMMEFTANFTVGMLRLTGIPVFREGTFFSIPSGDWSVIEACSGLRYLIASMTLGLLYAYLSYRSPVRRAAFIILAVIAPVIANGFRAYLIVMIAHLSDMKLATGLDHYLYGWVFFGLVMLVLFWIGSYWMDFPAKGGNIELPSDAGSGEKIDGRALIRCLVLGLGISALWPARAAYVEYRTALLTEPPRFALPETAGSWRAADSVTGWEPSYIGATISAKQSYSDGIDSVALYVMVYRHQGQGAELINSQNILIPQKHPVWKMPEEKPAEILLDGSPATVLQGRLLSSRQKLVTWRWNRIAGVYTANSYFGKLLEARQRMFGKVDDEAGILLATSYNDDQTSGERVLQRFINDMLPILEQHLDRAVEIVNK